MAEALCRPKAEAGESFLWRPRYSPRSFAIIVGVGGCVAYFWGTNWLLDRVLSGPAASAAKAARTICAARSGPGCSSGPALLILSVYLVYPVVETFRLSFPTTGGRELRRLRQLCLGLRRQRVPQLDPQQFPLAARGAVAATFLRPRHRRADRPHLVGQYRQVADLHADGDLLRRRQRSSGSSSTTIAATAETRSASSTPSSQAFGGSRRPGSPCPSGTTSS
jgi:hypothetical protein